MATIFNVHGYMTMRDCLEKIRMYVEVCAYKALCAAVSETNDPTDESWYPAFLDEERQIGEIHFQMQKKKSDQTDNNNTNTNTNTNDKPVPIPHRSYVKKKDKEKKQAVETDAKGYILNCGDLDMQAFMKIFHFRPAYRAKLVDLFGIENENKFDGICQELMSYRNTEFAHLPVKISERELAELKPEQEQKIIKNCNETIQLFFSFLRYFPQLNSESNASTKESFYNRAHNEWCKAKETLRIEEVEVESFLKREKLSLDVHTLIDICNKCGVTVVIPEGNPYLIITDYKKTMPTIRAMAQMYIKNEKNLHSKAELEKELEKTRVAAHSKRKQQGIVIGLCALFIAILVVLLVVLMGRGNTSTPASGGQTDGNDRPSQSQSDTQQEQQAASQSTQDAPGYAGTPFISGTGSYAGLTLQVNQMKAPGILINYVNDELSDYSLGWVGGAKVDVKTTVGTFTVETEGNQKIYKGTSGAFSVNLGQELMGQIQSIIIRDLKPLSASGLPQGNSCTVEIPITEGNPTAGNTETTKYISGEISGNGLTLSIDQKLSSGISVSYKNGSEYAYSLGWAGNAKAQIKTTDAVIEGSVSQSSLRIEKNSAGSFVIEVSGLITGTVTEIVICNVNVLTESGLPSFTQQNQRITIPITQTEK